MTTPHLQARRATIEDLPRLMLLWQEEGAPAEVLGKRLPEFQLVEAPGGEIVGAIALQIAGTEARLHSECFARAEDADLLRTKLWERTQMISRNHGLLRLWTQLPAPFWSQTGFREPSPALAQKLPPAFAGLAEPWAFLQLREDITASPVLDKEFAMFKEMQQAETERLMRQAKTMKAVAIVVVLVVFAFTLFVIIAWMKANAARHR